ncbi:MAG: tetratricopeptide repeat protein [Planctomycetes bacterium]|nr:tetratricopeptide repeat protein [Planctomycetota bacterium]
MAPQTLFRFFARFHLWKPAVLLERAEKCLLAHDYDGAESLLNQAIQRAPEWAEAGFLMARLAKQREDKTEEEGWLMHALACDSRHIGAEKALLAIRAWQYQPVMQGWKLFHAGRFESAAQLFEAALLLIPERVPAVFRGEIHEALGWCAWELSSFAAGSYEKGAEHFRHALGEAPEKASAHKGLGMCLFRMQEHAAAEASLMEALRINPKLYDARAFRGWVACSQAQWESAHEHFEASRKINMLSGDACWGLAWACANLGRIKDSFAAYREAFELEPDHATRSQTLRWFLADPLWNEMLLPFAMSLLKANRAKAALEVLDASFGKVPRVQWAGGRAFAFLQDGRPREVESALSRLESSELDLLLQTGHTPRQLKALAAQAQGHYEAAFGHMELAMKHSAHDGLRLDMGRLWAETGSEDKAFELYTALLSSADHSNTAQTELAGLAQAGQKGVLDALENHLLGGLAHDLASEHCGGSEHTFDCQHESAQAVWVRAIQAQSLGDLETTLELIQSQIKGNLTPSPWFLLGAQVAEKLGDLRLSHKWKTAASSYLPS